MPTPVQICYGNMSIGQSSSRLTLSVIEPNSKLKGMPSKSWISKAPMAVAAAHSSIVGCGEWRTQSLLVENVSYLHINCGTSYVNGSQVINSVASIVVRVHEGGSVLSIHAKIPDEAGSTMIGGMVHTFQGRGDILTEEEVLALKLNVPIKNLAPEAVKARFRITDYKTDPDIRRNIVVNKSRDGKISESVTTERRRKVRIRRR